MRLAVLVVAALLLSAVAARADGDPASDWLYTQKVFVPFDVKASKASQQALVSSVEGAWKQQFRIKVAVIGGRYDLGAVPSLWNKPQTYARFLGEELGFLYKQRLLVVMPTGFGFFWKGHDTTAEYAALRTIHVAPGADGLVQAANDAVMKLGSTSGVSIVGSQAPADHTNRDRLLVIIAALVAIGLAVLGRVALRRRR